MFTPNNAVVQIMKSRRARENKPKAGDILCGIKNLPVRVHCQPSRSKEDEIFAYTTMVFLRPELTSEGQQWFLRDYASPDLGGTKMILNSRSREALLQRYAAHPVFSETDVLPIASVRVIREATSGKSFEVEIHSYLSDESDWEELCAEYARIALAGDQAEIVAARHDFYSTPEPAPVTP